MCTWLLPHVLGALFLPDWQGVAQLGRNPGKAGTFKGSSQPPGNKAASVGTD